VFKVVVPKDFGDDKLTWKLTAHGQTQQVIGTLKPVWQIDRLRTTRGGSSEKISSNLPPAVTVKAADEALAGAAPTTLTITATDDGLPKRRGETVADGAVGEVSRSGPVRSPPRAKLANGRRRHPPLQRAGRYICRRSSTTARASRRATSATLLLDEHAVKVTVRAGARADRQSIASAISTSRRTSRRSSRRTCHDLPSPGHRRRRCRSVTYDEARPCGEYRSGSASPTATCRRGIST
jgi:hypothetical protein